MQNLPEANDQQPSLEELGPEYDSWLDDSDIEDYVLDFDAEYYSSWEYYDDQPEWME